MMSMLLVLLMGVPQVAPTPPTLTITVIDAGTNAPIADVQVQLRRGATTPADAPAAEFTARTDATGVARFAAVPPGAYTLSVSTIGYIFVRRPIDVPAQSMTLTVPLTEGTGAYQEAVTVSADVSRSTETGVASQMELGSAALQDLRGVATDDPMRAVQGLPGVVTGDDFQAEFSVRGSAFRHVGIVLDGIQSPLLMHAVRGRDDTGSIAMINSDVLERASLLAGPHPLRHGDWLGATLEFGVREGSRDRVQLRAAVSGTSASAVLEGPLTPARKGAWLISLRKSYVDWLVRKLDPLIASTIGFADAQSVLTLDLTSRQQLRVLLVGGQAVYQEQDTGVANGLARAVSTGGMVSLGWRYTGDHTLISQKVSASISSFTNTGVRSQDLGGGTTASRVWRGDILQNLSPTWALESGARVEQTTQDQTLRRFTTTSTGGLRVTAERFFDATTTLSSVYGQVGHRTPQFGFSIGARASRDTRSGDQWVSPWLLTEVSRGRLTVRASAGASHQRPALEYESAAVEPLRTESARAADLSLGLRLSSTTRLQVTPFVRDDTHLLRPMGEDRVVDGRRVASTPFYLVASRVDGHTQGVDVLLQRRATRGLTGWIAYTWAHTTHDDTTTGEQFDGDLDQRHTINVFLLQRLSFRSTMSAKLRLGSNVPLVGYFSGTTDALKIAESRNQVRLPWYARLDLRANRTFTFARTRLTVFAEVVNVLGRRNLGQADGFSRTNFEAVFFTEKLIPRIPSAGFLIEF
jgi:hypothetical protein